MDEQGTEHTTQWSQEAVEVMARMRQDVEMAGIIAVLTLGLAVIVGLIYGPTAGIVLGVIMVAAIAMAATLL